MNFTRDFYRMAIFLKLGKIVLNDGNLFDLYAYYNQIFYKYKSLVLWQCYLLLFCYYVGF